jgi:hypothetical protein
VIGQHLVFDRGNSRLHLTAVETRPNLAAHQTCLRQGLCPHLFRDIAVTERSARLRTTSRSRLTCSAKPICARRLGVTFRRTE